MKKLDRPVLAEGEVTGHAHVIDAEVEVFEDKDQRFFNLKESATIVHEEHKPITIPEGNYASGKVMEYDHFAEEAKQVTD
ncbi:MAG TPA: hypothetical protein VI911_10795 [Patescibacteria group bacterium]|nr:hypothetical protein [Patescibacteria group bacterium]